MKKLVIVESPNKCSTLERYLGDEYVVKASKGHIRDLSKKGKGGYGVDIEHDFTPTYDVLTRSKAIVKDLIKTAKNSSEVILATDPDREGEAIAWHLKELLNLKDDNKRLEFHEITRDSISKAIENPRTIDLDLVRSQETRRIIDRIFGFRISGLLRRKVVNVNSGGRVQSATLKLIVDREREINAFKPTTYYSLNATLSKDNKEFNADFNQYKGIKKIESKEVLDKILESSKDPFKVKSIDTYTKEIDPGLPFTTSTVQQAAINQLGMTSREVTSLLQTLYEGLSVNGEHVGLITYIRTDSTYLSETFITRARAFIKENYGEEYIAPDVHFKSKKNKNAQNAHEAIRPTSNHRTPDSVKPYLTNDKLYKLYKLIYEHTLAVLMKKKKQEVIDVLIGNDEVDYKIKGKKIIYKGFGVVTGIKSNEEEKLPVNFNLNDEIKVIKLNPEEKQTEPPSRYNEAKIIKLMEEKGIGRPSTYSLTITNLSKKGYIKKVGKAFAPSKTGIESIEFLEENFKEMVDTSFTAELETRLDQIEDGEINYLDVLKGFYYPFEDTVKEVLTKSVGTCPLCGSPLRINRSKHGTFIGCSNYPNCKYIKKDDVKKDPPKEVGRVCPECGAQLVERVNKRGQKFVGCSNFPKCHYIEGATPKVKEEPKIIKKCPECKDGYLVLRHARKDPNKLFLGCNNFPKCRHIEDYTEESEEEKN